ncbi:prolyl 4-hydroxylase subunit alpha-1 [Brachyhypopomus gauderio]|uniref:prolyl 4-hydroxylase subunit alpha-1 n=1 Tax=Brachyhypopomus gauderio TaxID=698409 RepID=UPI004042B2F4
MDSGKYLILCCCLLCVKGHEFYSSTDKIASLAEVEEELLDMFSDFIQTEEEILEELARVYCDLKLLFSGQMEYELSNPVASYKLMSRMTEQWRPILTYIKKRLAQDDLYVEDEDEDEEFYHLPRQVDIDGAARGIIRLQDMYKLHPQDITKDPQTGREILLNPDESFHLGKMACDLQQYQHAFLWFQQSLSQISAGQEAMVKKIHLLQHLVHAAYLYGDMPHAVDYSQRIWRLDPTNVYANLDMTIFSQNSYPDILTLNSTPGSRYEALCRGEAASALFQNRKSRPLSCRHHVDGGNRRLSYAPVWVEEEWDEPSIIRYHDVLSESEMEILKSVARPLLERSMITGWGEGVVSHTRVSQNAWLYDEDDPVVSRVTQRLSCLTGLDMKSSEPLQVLNYGIGGQFEPHYDAGTTKSSESGQRIASIIIYLSDVRGGGATVFPEVGVSLKPLKGSAVLWYNLLQNGDLSDLSLHAGCPVWHGSKWVAIKWVHERGQEFRRPCSLSKTE